MSLNILALFKRFSALPKLAAVFTVCLYIIRNVSLGHFCSHMQILWVTSGEEQGFSACAITALKKING